MTANFQSRERRRKMIRRVLRRVERVSLVVLWWCLGMGVIFGGYIAVTMLPLFSVSSIIVHGELAHLTRESVKQLANIPVGANIFGVDVVAVQHRLNDEPWVAEAAVRRKLPNTIWIYVGERIPVALLNLDGLYLVDTDGNIFKKWENADSADLPVLSGVNDVAVDDTGVGHSDQVISLMRFRNQFEQTSVGDELGVSEVLMEKYGRISIVTAARPFMYLRFGEGIESGESGFAGSPRGVWGHREAPEVIDASSNLGGRAGPHMINDQLGRLREVMPYMAKDKVASVDLSIERKIIVKVGT